MFSHTFECSRLSELCSSLCRRDTPRLDPDTCVDILLTKYETPENVLLQLSAVRCLYSSCTPPTNDMHTSHMTITTDDIITNPQLQQTTNADFETLTQNIIETLSHHLQSLHELLSGHLESSNQHICFCASKALVCVLLHTEVKAHMITGIFNKIQNHIYSHVCVYCLQTIRELLKSLRKHRLSTVIPEAKRVQSTHKCLKSIADNHHWLRVLELFLTESSDASCRLKLEPAIGEFLSLTVELLRHKQLEQASSSNLSTVAENTHLHCIVTNLLRLLSLVEGCENVFVLKRFVDVSLKAEVESHAMEILHFVAPSLQALLFFPVCKDILQCWMESCGAEVLPESAILPQAKRSCLEHMKYQNEFVCIFVRKTILFVVKCIARLLINLTQFQLQTPLGPSDNSLSVLRGILLTLRDLLSRVGLARGSEVPTQQYTSALYQVVSEDDGCLVHVLEASTSILKHTISSSFPLDSVPGLVTFLTITDPHSLWLHFLSNMDFDHSVLLDLIISPETHFTSALHDYLELATRDWKNLVGTCTHRTSCQLVPSCDGAQLKYAVSGRREAMPHSCSQEHGSTDDSSTSAHGGDPSMADLSLYHLPPPTPKERWYKKSTNTECTADPTTTVLVDYSSSSSSEDEQCQTCDRWPDKLSQCPAQINLPHKVALAQINLPHEVASPPCKLHPFSSCSVLTTDKPVNTSELAPSNVPGSSLRISESPSLPSSSGSLLGRLMGCLIRLRMSMERLGGSGLLPPHVISSDLITAIENVEELYEAQHGE